MCMKTFFISLIFIIQTVNCKIVVFYGTFNGDTQNISDVNLNWVDCVCWCQTTDECSFVFWLKTSQVCNVAFTNSSELLADITYTNDTSDMQIAMKTDYSNCYDAIELLKTRYIDCKSNYSRVFRQNYTLCLARKYHTYWSYSEATEVCSENGDIPIGAETDQERISMGIAKNIYNKSPASTWVGLTRNDSDGAFYWTDPWITGNGSIVWAEGHPIEGNDCASIQTGTALIQSDNCSYSPCDSHTYCPSIVICGKLLG